MSQETINAVCALLGVVVGALIPIAVVTLKDARENWKYRVRK